MFGDQVANATAPLFGKFRGMRRCYDIRARMLREMPRRVQNTGVSRFGRAWRHENSKAISLAVRDLFKLPEQQTMVRCWLKSRVQAPIS
jgi:hypothetical protein